MINTVFCVVLTAICIALLTLSIQYTVQAIEDGEFGALPYSPSSSHHNLYPLLLARSRLNIAYSMLSMGFSIEILVLSVMTLVHPVGVRATRVVGFAPFLTEPTIS